MRLDNPQYALNSPNRCYFCKEELFARRAPSREQGERTWSTARTWTILGDHRPGMQAGQGGGRAGSQIEAELWKTEIRALARELGLPTWDKPSFACLSSRFQYGETITPEKLRLIDAAEAFVRGLGFRQFRVRHHDKLARLELPPEEMARLFEDGRHEAVVKRFRELGSLYVPLDLRGSERQRQRGAQVDREK